MEDDTPHHSVILDFRSAVDTRYIISTEIFQIILKK